MTSAPAEGHPPLDRLVGKDRAVGGGDGTDSYGEGGSEPAPTVGGLQGTGYLSYSQVKKYRGCGEQYRQHYILQAPVTPSGAGIAGTAIHLTIEESEQNGWWGDPDLYEKDAWAHKFFVAKFNELLKAAIEAQPDLPVHWGGRKSKQFPEGENFLWWVFSSTAMLKKYAAIRRRDHNRGIVIETGGVERQMNVLVPIENHESILLRAYIDAVTVNYTDGTTGIRDWKSGTWLDPLQLVFYAWIVEQVDDVTVDRAEFGYLRSREVDNLLKPVPVAQLKPLVPRFVHEAAEGISSGVFPLNPSNLCGSCGVKQHCPWGQGLIEAEGDA